VHLGTYSKSSIIICGECWQPVIHIEEEFTPDQLAHSDGKLKGKGWIIACRHVTRFPVVDDWYICRSTGELFILERCPALVYKSWRVRDGWLRNIQAFSTSLVINTCAPYRMLIMMCMPLD